VYRFVDVQGDPLEAIQGIIVLILALFVLKNVFDFGRTYLVARVEQAVTRDLRNEVYDHVLNLDLAFFGRTRVGQITSRLTHDVERLRTLITKEMAKILSSLFEFLVAVGFMLILSWKLTLAAFVVLPGTMGIWGPLVKRLRRDWVNSYLDHLDTSGVNRRPFVVPGLKSWVEDEAMAAGD